MGKDIHTAYAKTARAVEDITGARLITGPSRKAENTRARGVVIQILAEQGFTEHQIGSMINRDHSTVHYHKEAVSARLRCPASDRALFQLYTQTKAKLCLQ